MVQALQGPSQQCKDLLQSMTFSLILKYLDPIEAIQLQQVSKNFYNKVIPRNLPRVENPTVSLVLERSRKDIQLGCWRANRRHLKTKQLLKIGTGEGEISPETLKFSEVYF